MKKRFICFTAVYLCFVILAGCSVSERGISDQTTVKVAPEKAETESPKSTTQVETIATSKSTNGNITMPDLCAVGSPKAILKSMSLEDKVGQMLFLAFRQTASGAGITKMDKETESSILQLKPGGIALFQENLVDIQQTVTLITDMQTLAEVPMLMGVDEEGGMVARVARAKSMHATQMPNNVVIGNTGNPENAYAAADIIASEIRSLGFNMNFAPVADINSNPNNPVIGKRSFGSDPLLVSEMVAASVRAYQDNRVACVLKHFPGHGDTATDSHSELPTVEHDEKRLLSFELKPFEAGFDAGAQFVMTAHIRAPNASGNDLPATLNPYFLKDLLRDRLNFQGVVITDGMEMKAITDLYPEEEACILAIEAGADMLLMPLEPKSVKQAIVDAVLSGRLSEDRIDESVMRILKAKEATGIFECEWSIAAAEKTLGSKEHLETIARIKEDGK